MRVAPGSYQNCVVTPAQFNGALTGGTLVNGTGVMTGSPVALTLLGSTEITVTAAGTFVISLPVGYSGVATSATSTITNGPVTLVPGNNTVTATTGLCNIALYPQFPSLTNGTGDFAGYNGAITTPLTVLGPNVITVLTTGTFVIFLPSGFAGTVTSGSNCTVSGSPVTLVYGNNTITATLAAGATSGTFTIALTSVIPAIPNTGATCANGTGICTNSPLALLNAGTNTVTIGSGCASGGTFTLTLPGGGVAIPTSGTATVTGSGTAIVAPSTAAGTVSNTLTVTGTAGQTFTIAVTTPAVVLPDATLASALSGLMNIVISPATLTTSHTVQLATGGTITNGTGVATGSPVSLLQAANSITVTTAGTFTIALPAQVGATVSGCGITSAMTLLPGSSTVVTTTATGTLTVTVYYTRTVYVSLQDGSGNYHTWFTGKLTQAITQTGSGTANIVGGGTTLQFTKGVATVQVQCTGTWASTNTNTLTISGTLLGNTLSSVTSVETSN
jgi:hypothetical protein